MKTNLILISAILVIVCLGAGFFGGTLYQKSKQPRFTRGQGQQFIQGRPVSGEITGLDDKSITVKSPDGSSKIVILSETTKYSKSVDGVKKDFKTGDKVMVIGQANSDGSVTAQTIQLNPNFAIR